MWDDFIARQIRRTNRNLLLLGSAMLAILGTTVGLCWRDVSNFVFGPFPVQASELNAVWSPDAPKHYFLKVRGKESFATGMREVDAADHSRVRAEVMALVVGQRLLLVKAPSSNAQVQFSGTLATIPGEIQSSVVQAWDAKHPDMKGAFLPVMLDATTDFRKGDNLIVALVAIFLGGLGLLLAGMSFRRRLQPERHPLLARLAQYGNVQDVRARIDAEIRGEGGGEKFGAIQITTNWLIHSGAYKTGVMASRDIVWAYSKVTKHYHSGIPTGKTYSSIIRDNKGQSLEVSGKKDSVPKLLESLQRRMPWILIGYSKELDALWAKQKAQFFQLMEQRRAQLSPASR